MKNIIALITLVLALSSVAHAQTSQQCYSRIRDATNPALVAAVGAANAAIVGTVNGLTTRSFTYRYNSTSGNWEPVDISHRLYVVGSSGEPELNPAATNYTACTGADQSITLPVTDGVYIIQCIGASCVMTLGQAAALNGEGMFIFEGVPTEKIRIQDPGPTLRIICTNVNGSIRVIYLEQ